MNVVTQLRRRPVTETELPDSLPALLRRLYAQRGVRQAQELERSLRGLLDYRLLSGIAQAVDVLCRALAEERRIVIVGDFDADGATSTALTVLALRSMGGREVQYLVPNRFEDGYGLSPEVVAQAATKGRS